MNTNYEDLEVYKLSENLSDMVWNIVIKWNNFEKDTIGKQLVKAADSIGSNIAEGSGRGSYFDNKRFVKISRGSLFETKNWINKAFRRGVISEFDNERLLKIIEELIPRLSAFINYLTKKCKLFKNSKN
jgi:four helix bundle protein